VDGGGEKSGEEGLVGGVGEAAGGMTGFPALGHQLGEIWESALLEEGLGHVVAEGVEGDQKDIMGANHVINIVHKSRSTAFLILLECSPSPIVQSNASPF
jgi:hypothetical protein